ncbi:Hypothetical protein D9617_1g087220 [Elsinoe fawcettii]|nr:Hypothetical protein D9617_1g087220 [Elsinoe fawcettii]
MAPNGFPAGQLVQPISLVDETAIAWCNLPEDEPIALFTPLVTQPSSDGSNQEKDPFEDLGRALQSIHPGQVKHASYTPNSGISSHHIDWIDETATVLVVICQPAGFSQEAQRKFLDQQTAFARSAMREYHRIHEGTEPDALVLLYCGSNTYTPPDTIGTTWRVGGYTSDYWPAVASKLLQGHE